MLRRLRSRSARPVPRWKYEDGFEELYDREIDPYEMESVANNSRYAEVKAALLGQWNALKDCTGKECQVASAVIPDPEPNTG